ISRSQLIQLSNDKPFASGGHRDCFRHPDGSNRCIKVLHEPWKEIDRRKKDPLRHVRRRRNYDENRQEWFELRKLERKLNSKVALHFPKQYGFVKTDLGEGLVV